MHRERKGEFETLIRPEHIEREEGDERGEEERT
jgi:hypothetical protein